MLSCNDIEVSLQELDRIKQIGNVDPKMALSMMDSLIITDRNKSEYFDKKYELLLIRLHDKAIIPHISDKEIKEVLGYFLDKGTILEKQEVLYYAGSVYRDLQDYPSAISYFLNSIDIAEENHYQCDSLLLRNSYSNLSYLYNHVQDNQNYYTYSLKEYRLAKQLDMIEDPNYLHLAEAYLMLDSLDQAITLFDTVLVKQKNSDNKNIDILSNLLYNYNNFQQIDKASECIALIDSFCEYESMDDLGLFAYGWYHYKTNQISKAEEILIRVLERTDDLESKYNISRYLLYIYNELGQRDKALSYGLYFAQISDSLNLGKRQELASTITNVYKYNRDKEEERKIKEEKLEYQNNLYRLIIASILFLVLIIWYIISIKHKHLKESVYMNMEISRISGERSILRKEMQSKTEELEETKLKLNKATEDVVEKKSILNKINEELATLSNELKQKEQILNERMEQNQLFIKLLHQTKLEKSAEEVILALRQSAMGRRSMSSEDWRRFYKAVDELYPSFNRLMLQNLGKFSQEQMQVCYLMRVGFSKPQIQNLTGLSRVTVWRWDKKFEWINNGFQQDTPKDNKL